MSTFRTTYELALDDEVNWRVDIGVAVDLRDRRLIRINIDDAVEGGQAAGAFLTPAQARDYARALLAAADEQDQQPRPLPTDPKGPHHG